MGNTIKANRVLFTGGHAGTTAIAVISELLKSKKDIDVHWIGSKKAIEGSNALTLEAKVLPSLGVKFHSIIAGKLQKKWSKHTILSIMKVPVGFIHAFQLLVKIKPTIVFSFGGYSAFPVVFASYLLRIPVILQEQITGLGLANRLSLPFSNKVLLSRSQGLQYSGNKGLVFGNPVSSAFTRVMPKKVLHDPPTLFIFAGSRGSQIINDTVLEIMPGLLTDFNVVHQTGDLDYDKISKFKSTLPLKLEKKYTITPFIDPSKVPSFYDGSDILVGRAGANTVSELMVVGIPSILIPFPFTNYKDQEVNAREAERRGIAEVISQKDLNSKLLLSTIIKVRNNWQRMAVTYKKDLSDLDRRASGKIVKYIVELMNK